MNYVHLSPDCSEQLRLETKATQSESTAVIQDKYEEEEEEEDEGREEGNQSEENKDKEKKWRNVKNRRRKKINESGSSQQSAVDGPEIRSEGLAGDA